MIAALLLSGVTFLSTMAGGLAVLRWPGRAEWLMALAGGVVLGAALFDLLPEAVEHAEEHGLGADVPIGAMLGGILLFSFAERWTHHGEDHHHDGHDAGADAPEAGPSSAGLVGAAGFVAHSFFDGLAIGLGFRVDDALGLLVALAVIGHDFSDGLNTVSILRAARHPVERSRRWLYAVASAPIVGALVASVAPVPEDVLPVSLGFFAGLFLYAAATHLLPAANRLPWLGGLLTTAGGAGAMFAIAHLAGHGH
ncbi:ZIP family metal transporter [Conexibacter sp. SYSU D00693]|uniref:ZIP family metal transporter n=1 Tax=Conexibacter sp. SYSU D00693 TaxID=2812560 RepID=UPI00196AAF34|nr:ZIP family metal transporter [Conexibacter sp. SYSU D00693]